MDNVGYREKEARKKVKSYVKMHIFRAAIQRSTIKNLIMKVDNKAQLGVRDWWKFLTLRRLL